MNAQVAGPTKQLRATAANILVVDANAGGHGLLGSILELAGHTVVSSDTTTDTQALLSRNRIDLALIDIDTGGDTLELLDGVRRHSPATAVIVLTESDDLQRKVGALWSGADDYITKPIHPTELLARVGAILRRSQGNCVRELSYAGLNVDLDRLIVTRDSRPVTLTPTELRLLILLLENAERVVSRGQILDQVWQYEFTGESLIVEKVVSNLRKKVDRGAEPLIQTIRGFGYTLRRPAH